MEELCLSNLKPRSVRILYLTRFEPINRRLEKASSLQHSIFIPPWMCSVWFQMPGRESALSKGPVEMTRAFQTPFAKAAMKTEECGSGPRLPGFKFWLCHLGHPACLLSHGLSFLIWTTGLIRVPTSQVCHEDYTMKKMASAYNSAWPSKCSKKKKKKKG